MFYSSSQLYFFRFIFIDLAPNGIPYGVIIIQIWFAREKFLTIQVVGYLCRRTSPNPVGSHPYRCRRSARKCFYLSKWFGNSFYPSRWLFYTFSRGPVQVQLVAVAAGAENLYESVSIYPGGFYHGIYYLCRRTSPGRAGSHPYTCRISGRKCFYLSRWFGPFGNSFYLSRWFGNSFYLYRWLFPTFARRPVQVQLIAIPTRAEYLAEGVEADVVAAAVVDGTLVHVLARVVVFC